MYKIVGGQVSSKACCLSRRPKIGGISETSKRQTQLKLKGLLFLPQVVELQDSMDHVPGVGNAKSLHDFEV